MSLTIAKDRLLKSMGIAQETELELYERLRDVARDFVDLKEEVANAGFNIKPWVRENLPRSYEWLQSHVRLYCGVGQVPEMPEVGRRSAIPAQ